MSRKTARIILDRLPAPPQHDLQFALLALVERRARFFEGGLEARERVRRLGFFEAALERIKKRRELAAELADEPERQAVHRRGAEPADRLLMLRRAVALVAREAV